MKKSILKKFTALVLCLLMVLPSVTAGFAPLTALLDGITTEAEAAVVENGKVAFIVPEVIYLAPNAQSWTAATTSTFQQYVENKPNANSIYDTPVVSATAATTGTIYFAASNGYSNVSIASRFIDANGAALSGGSVTVGSFAAGSSYGTFSITAGTSPSLAANVSGCYIEWTVTYTNSNNERQSAIAYTYVYKPYVVPFGGAVRAVTNKGTRGGDIYAQHIMWVSGVHGITPASSYNSAKAPNFLSGSGNRGLLGFLSNQSSGYTSTNNDTTNGVKAEITPNSTNASFSTNASQMYAVYGNNSYLDLSANNTGSNAWFNGATTMGVQSFDWYEHDGSASSNHLSVITYSKSQGTLTIDTSRYENLAQIPNLGIGFYITEDKSCDYHAWHVADATGISHDKKKTDYWQGNEGDTSTVWGLKNHIIASQYDGKNASYKSMSGFDDSNAEGLKYAGAWDREIKSSTSLYSLQGYFGVNNETNHAISSNRYWYYAHSFTFVDMAATHLDKSSLRTAVNNAINAMATIGLKDNYDSYYYDTASDAWKNFIATYKKAAMGLTLLDGTPADFANLASNLNNAVTALKNGQSRKIFFDVNYGNINPNLYILGNVTNGGAGLTVSYGADESITLNGTISGSNAFGTTPFTPKVGNYMFSATKLSGSITGNGCVVLDAGKEDANNISTRANFDFTGSAKKTFNYTSEQAQETDLLRFWQWKNTDNTVYDNFKFRIKVEEGSAQTAYSPAARIATSSGTYGSLPTPDARTGYTFEGWATSKDGTTPISANTNVDSDTLYAIWTPNKYTVTFDAQGGEIADGVNTKQVTYGSTYGDLPTPVKTGSDFKGWVDANGNAVSSSTAVEITANQTLYATWEVSKFTITWANHDGTVLEKDEGVVYNTVPTYDGATPVMNKEGYTTTWTGWNAEIVPATADVTYTATFSEVKNQYNLTIKYLFEDGSSAASSHTALYTYGDTYKVSTPAKVGYTPDIAVVEGVMGASNQEIVVTYSINSYKLTINYQYADGTPAAETHTENVKFAADYSVDSPAIEGYTADVLVVDGTMGTEDITVTVIYKANSYKLTVNYQYADGSMAAQSKEQTVVYKSTYNVESPVITGYTADQPVVTGTMPAKNTTITVKYSVNSYTLTVNYKYADGTPAAETHTENVEFAADYSVVSPAIEGYTPNPTVVSGTMPAENVTVDVTYTINSHLLKVVYVYADNNTSAATTYDETLNYGESYTVNSPSITGYTPDHAVVSGTMPDADVTITVKYSINSYTLTIHYVYANGEKAAEDVVKTYVYGSEYSVDSPVLTGYTADKPTVSGDFRAAENITETVTYAVNSYKATFIGFNGVEIDEQTIAFGSAVTTPEAPAVEGYTFKGWENLPATMPANDITVIAKYEINTHTVTWVDGSGNTLATEALTYGSTVSYKGEAPVKTGYTFTTWDSVPAAMPDSDVTITAQWKTNTYTVVFSAGEGAGAMANQTMTYDTAAKLNANEFTKEGHTFDGWLYNGTKYADTASVINLTATENGTVTLVAQWKVKSYTLTYNVDGVTTVQTLVYGAEIEKIEDPKKTGYTFAGWSPALPDTMPAKDLTVTAQWTINRYTIAFANTGDEPIAPITQDYATSVTAPASPTKTGYTFTGWDKTVPATMPAENMTITANWEANTYTVRFDANGGTGTMEDMTMTYDQAVNLSANAFSKELYQFNGWDLGSAHYEDGALVSNLTAENGATVVLVAKWIPVGYEYNINVWYQNTDGAYAADADITRKSSVAKDAITVSVASLITEYGLAKAGFSEDGAKLNNGTENVTEFTVTEDNQTVINLYFKRNSYKITFNTDGGSAVDSIEKLYGADVTVPAEPTKTGYTFVGWNKTIPATMPAEDMTITANWTVNQYTITFANTGDTAISPIKQDYNTTVTAPADPIRTGYTFAGWDKTIPATMPAENVTITAKWDINQYTITFDTVGGSAIEPMKQDYGTSVTAPANPTRDGYTFAGWDKTIPATMPAENMTITAKWTINQYTITFDTVGGTAIEAITQNYATDVIAPADPTREGYTFAGWDTSIPATMPAGDMTITAKWTVNQYTISFDSDGGSAVEALTQDYGTAVAAPAAPTKVGYTFIGWANLPATMPAENITVKAMWKINQYTITFDTLGGSSVAPITKDYGAAVTAPADPAKTGYTFKGWSGLPETMPAGNITVTANWEINQYTITFDVDGGSAIASITQDYGTVITAPANPTKEGYAFKGWAPALPTTMPAANTTVKAIWEIEKFTITFDVDGGTAIAPIEQVYGSDITAPADPTKLGYVFVKWEPAIPATMPGENIVIKAIWKIKTYTITFNTDGGTAIEPIEQAYGTPVVAPKNPTRQGYIFIGWDKTFPNNMPAQDTVLTAQWRAATDTKYTINYYQQDIGADTYTLIESAEGTGTTNTTVTPQPKAYEGFTAPKAESAVIKADGSMVIDYYYTRNQYSVIYNTDGGSAVSVQTWYFGETIVPAVTELQGYTFTGWSPALPETMTAGNLYVTATWAPATDTPYTVYHYYQDVDGISFPEALLVIEECHGTTASIVDAQLRPAEGFTTPAMRTVLIAADGTATVRYYYTRQSYVVTFTNYDNTVLSKQSVLYGCPATAPTLSERAADAEVHYIFNGWSQDISFIKGNVTVQAVYESEAHTESEKTSCTQSVYCLDCGYEILPANTHKPLIRIPAVEATCYDSGNTADSVCELCGEVLSVYKVIPFLGHTLGSWYVDVPATETETGILRRNCIRCGWYEKYDIPVLSDVPVDSVDITTSGTQGYIGTSYQLKTAVFPADAGNQQVLWESSDPSVATVNNEGYVVAKKPGEVTFTVLTLDGLRTDSITINFFYSASYYSLMVVDLFGCNLYLDGKLIDESMISTVRVKAGSTLAFTLEPTTDAYTSLADYVFTANGMNVNPDANGVYYIYNVYENIEISALPIIGDTEFDDNQDYDTQEPVKNTIFSKLLAFFERIVEWFKNLFK